MQIIQDLDLSGKRLLVLGGPDVHSPVVRAAQELGMHVTVTDRGSADECPAMAVADAYWQIDFSDVHAVVEKCREYDVDGVINFCINPAQEPYVRICNELGLPCYGTEKQFAVMTKKSAFLEKCAEVGLPTIKRYDAKSIERGEIEYPVLVKPSVGRASRGQRVCWNENELQEALRIARTASADEVAIVEEYVRGAQDFALACIVVDGEPYPLKAGDRYTGLASDGLERQHVYTVSPSRQIDSFKSKTLPLIRDLVENLGYRFGPLFLQGFISQGTVRFYDPDLRFPGSDFVASLKTVAGFDAMKTMVAYAVTGDGSRCFGDPSAPCGSRAKPVGMLSIPVRPGRIANICGYDEIANNPRILYARMMAHIGDEIPASGDVAQRAAEFIIRLSDREEMEEVAEWIYRTLAITDGEGLDMKVSRLSFSNGLPVVI